MIGTHVVLLREPESNAAKVFLFGESGTNQNMKLWRFFASADSARLPDTLNGLPASQLRYVPHPDALANDLFCNGHSILPDGRMLFIGGNYQPQNACETVYTFDPAWFGGTASPWTTAATMAAERWYATATGLADGRVLAAAGQARSWLGAFGGRTSADSSDRVWRSVAFAARYHWGDTSAVPANNNPNQVTRVYHNDYTAGQFPPAREDHVMAPTPVGTAVLFGGRNVRPGVDTTTLGDAWLLRPSQLQNDSVMTWTRLHQVDDNPTAGVPEVLPSPRTRAAMVWAGINWRDTTTCLPRASDSLTCFLFGGRDASGNALGDLWVGRLDSLVYRYGVGMTQDWRWTQLLPDAPERRRYGHSMWFDPGDGGPGAPYARLVLFGGQFNDSTLAGNKVYTYGVGSHPTVAAKWDSLVPTGAANWGSPQARQGHMATHKRPLLAGATRKFYLYGGQDARGNLLPPEQNHPEPNDTHVWALTRSDTTATPSYEWDWVAWSNHAGDPVSRARGAMSYDSWSERLVVVGGDLNGDGQSGGLTDSVWCIQVESYGGGVLNRWFSPLRRSLGHPVMPATKGHTLIAYGDAGYINESSLEAYNPSGTSQSCAPWSNPQGTWTTVSTQDSLSQRAISAYPFLFLLPDGRLFNAGPAPADRLDQRYKRFYSLTTEEWSDDTSNHLYDAKVMGSAVMYRPGKVLRAGSHGAGDIGAPVGGAAHGRTETVEIGTGASPAWVERVPNQISTFAFSPRLNHNLTVLPTGDVLATGGAVAPLNPNNLTANSVLRPQLWRVGLGGWNNNAPASADTLNPDPRIRNYHSAALLLPDGRVMTSGGEDPNNEDKWAVSVYEPPYLFSGNGYARRPVIAGAPEVLRYGEPFTMTIDTTVAASDPDSIRSVALLRPAAVTHGFDQNQRYVPLEFVAKHSPRRLLAWAPADSFVAPPGEYMLFVTRGRGTALDSLPVPSLAKWVVVQRPSGTQRDSLDVISPRGSAYFALERTNPCEPNSSISLRWKAPADDDTLAFSGRARSYNLRWSPNYQAPHFNLREPHATASPQSVSATESTVVGDLEDGVWYRFALKAIGDNADTSSLSNELVAKAILCEEGSSGGSGGGEGSRVQAAGVSGFSPRAGLSAVEENTLLAGVPVGTRGRDLLRLSGAPGRIGSSRRAFVRQGQGRGLLVERARLLAVDHAETTEVVVSTSGALLAGARRAAIEVRGRDGRDVTGAATGLSEEPVYADSGEVLMVTLPGPSPATSRAVMLDLLGGGGDTPGVTVEAQEEDGEWRALGTVHPRRAWAAVALPLTAAARVRLTFHAAYALRFVGELTGASPVVAEAAAMLGAASGYSGDVFDAARGDVDTTLAMVTGDTLSLLFADLPPTEVGRRTWLLEVEGTPVVPRVAQALARRPESAPQAGMPVAFALHPAAPNPTRGTVRLAFDLPQRASVRLEVFDPQGRRVRRLEGTYEAGRQALEWDLLHGSGPRVAPGIYSYRLTAGAFRAQRKLVVLP